MKKQVIILSFIILIILITIIIIYIPDSQIVSKRDIELPIQNIINQKNTSDEKIIQIKYDEIPSYADSKIVNKAIIDAMDRWSTINDDLTIKISTSDDYDIYIKWKKTLNDKQSPGKITGNLMELSFGGTDCDNNWRDYSMNTISDIITHEIGHYLGLEHTSNINYVMHGETILIKSVETISGKIIHTQDPFDDLGYSIPLINSIYYTWNVPDELQFEYHELQLEYDELVIKRDQLQKVYDQYNERSDAEWDYYESVKIYEQVHNLYYDVNTIFMKLYHVSDCQSYFDAVKYE